MIGRFSVNALLKSVFAAILAGLMTLLAIDGWDSWTRLRGANRTLAVVETSGHIFTALHNLRTDRLRTNWGLAAEKPATAIDPTLRAMRAAEVPALHAALASLRTIEFPDREAVIGDLEQKIKKLAVLHEQSTAAILRPKAERPPALAKDAATEFTALIDLLDQLSGNLNRLVKLDDSFIDQLLQLKALGWVARNAAGEASVVITSSLTAKSVTNESMVRYATHMSALNTAWAALEETASGLPLPARFTDAVAKAKSGFLSREFTDLRMNVLKAIGAGQPPGQTSDEYATNAVSKLTGLLGVAEAALDVARKHAARHQSAAVRKLALEFALIAAALVLAIGMMVLISRRVTRPLHVIQGAMKRLADGDLDTEVTFAERRDEIGALAGTMQVFKDSMRQAKRLRAEQKETEARAAAARKAEMQRMADAFQAAVGNVVEAVSMASAQLESSAGTLTTTAEATQRLSGLVETASAEASSNVSSVASAAEEMAGSVKEIARQVHTSSRIAAEAVSQAERTDARISELSSAAGRIGDVVKLITAIAEQTNLLALNATIEAARAGDAGRGFAVVASEVKALASQTAKATEEIGTQIATMQSATRESVGAIKEIGGTIGQIAEIASAIAAAVEEQGAATQEISRNVAQAASGTAQVAGNISDVNRGASETGAASADVLRSAQLLARESGQLKDEVERFLGSVRAA
jgi:methyl-accepting chemotaxis protein